MTVLSDQAESADPVSYDTLILGLGNVLWADEGFGVRTAEALNARYTFAPGVHVMDGGTQGIFLIPWVRSARRLLILDAVDYGLAPGTLKVVLDDDVPRFMGAKKVSMHQAGFQEVLMSAKLTGDFPDKIALVGVQPELLDDYGGSLTARVKARVPDAIDAALSVLADWDVAYQKRSEPLAETDLIGPGALAIDGYESGRPI
ncbi:MAG: HyaD/HybD family hydrogenase maturation endopeptidase [Chromatiales bacterium]|jgi:hydrogenase maturation protease|nr:HyaD/HybD family hydrogenase maturation endopeptidase [Chromatiales bacterium]MDH3932982.1 HyaD/HybD family hydrogenase maturation endopeptidase [Chromatiales bacterium]MDH3970072.1 HyaD/HybD family hydrogenase maturation endopeptidase [Rhodospirillales bacterium]PLX56909.1 MAG: HyaD/HybD family hydrogenase maturation endopeptidase [Chromatiales bacterium]